MKIHVTYFGKLADVTGTKREEFELDEGRLVSDLLHEIESTYPMEQAPYAVSVNHRIVESSHSLVSNSEVALLPPFSGG